MSADLQDLQARVTACTHQRLSQESLCSFLDQDAIELESLACVDWSRTASPKATGQEIGMKRRPECIILMGKESKNR